MVLGQKRKMSVRDLQLFRQGPHKAEGGIFCGERANEKHPLLSGIWNWYAQIMTPEQVLDKINKMLFMKVFFRLKKCGCHIFIVFEKCVAKI
jgi:hypothetical protein